MEDLQDPDALLIMKMSVEAVLAGDIVAPAAPRAYKLMAGVYALQLPGMSLTWAPDAAAATAAAPSAQDMVATYRLGVLGAGYEGAIIIYKKMLLGGQEGWVAAVQSLYDDAIRVFRAPSEAARVMGSMQAWGAASQTALARFRGFVRELEGRAWQLMAQGHGDLLLKANAALPALTHVLGLWERLDVLLCQGNYQQLLLDVDDGLLALQPPCMPVELLR